MSRGGKDKKRAPGDRYVVLALLAAVAGYHTVLIAVEVKRTWDDPGGYALPFRLKLASREVERVEEAAGQVVKPGDRIEAVDGKRLKGLVSIRRFEKSPVEVELVRDGQRMTAVVPLREQRQQFTRLEERILSIVLLVLMPGLALLLGSAAAVIRIRDPQAWMLLLLMLTFPHLVRSEITGSGPWAYAFDQVYRLLMLGFLPAAMVLFATYFAERLRLDVKAPWLKWLLLGPSAALGLLITVAQAARLADLTAMGWLQRLIPWISPAYTVLMFASIAAFFIMLSLKYTQTQQLDVKRRLRMLLAGTQAAMGPLFVLIVMSIALQRPVVELAEGWLLTVCLLALALFPITFTYVILVHRALDLRVAIRQGIQYALVRSGATLLIGALAVGVYVGMYGLVKDSTLDGRRAFGYGVAATAAIFLLDRLRVRFARWIDKRFFRSAYDAERLLTEVSEQLRTIIEPEPLLSTLGKSIAEHLNVPRLALLVADGAHYRPAYAVGYDTLPDLTFGAEEATVSKLRLSPEPARVYFDDEDSWVWRTPEMTEAEREKLSKLETQLILPLAVKERLIGFISLGQKRSEEPYSGSDLRLLRSLAAQSALALENSQLTAAYASEAAQREKLNRELEIAREVQERLFPQKAPSVPGLDIAGGCRPALGVGGDYYDFLELPGGRLGIVIGDVSGKGIAAALLMASLQASVRGQRLNEGQALSAVITHVNALIYEASTSSRYATLFYAQYDLQSRQMVYVNAGHNPPLLMRAGGTVELLDKGGTVVGLLPRFPYQQGEVTLESGDVLVSFTDGVSEAQNDAHEEWGEERLMQVVRESNGLSAAELIPRIIAAADEFAAGAPQHDDMTLVIARVN
jgi:sigma-B regulation protein RsbU (phosphoserine phosphatase)